MVDKREFSVTRHCVSLYWDLAGNEVARIATQWILMLTLPIEFPRIHGMFLMLANLSLGRIHLVKARLLTTGYLTQFSRLG